MEFLAVIIVVGGFAFGIYKLKQKIIAKKDAKHAVRFQKEIDKINNKHNKS